MVNYSKSKIYKLCCKDITITDIYIGSTTSWRARKKNHKNHSTNENVRMYNFYVYQFIRDNGGFDNWDMIEIERYDAKDKLDLSKRERYWIEELKPTLNTVKKPYRTKEEERVYKNKWSRENERRRERIKCDCGGYYQRKHKSTHIKTKKHQKYLETL